MLDNCQSQEERWQSVQQLVTRWLAERQELVVIYCALSSIRNFSTENTTCLTKLRQFCEILMDYTSAGHFEVYEELVKEAQTFNDNSSAVLDRIYPEIAETTTSFIDFNDTYDTDEHCVNAIGRLKDELSELGEQMATRFALEDQLIDTLHLSHAK
jgi:regulator of sigma D